nr:MAG TPA: hypothetical protein [Caudoviricetes sp.]
MNMKYKERDFKDDTEVKEIDYGLEIYDGKDNKYVINVNPFGEIEITSSIGNLIVNPRYANQIIIKTEE